MRAYLGRVGALLLALVGLTGIIAPTHALALTEPVFGIDSVVCRYVDRVTGQEEALVELNLSMERINQTGFEYFQVAPFYYDIVNGTFHQQPWSPFNQRFGPTDYPYPNLYPIFTWLKAGNYYWGSWFKWWYNTGTGWASVTRWSWASSGAYYSDDSDVLSNPIPRQSCMTNAAYFNYNVVLQPGYASRAAAAMPRAGNRLEELTSFDIGAQVTELSRPSSDGKRGPSCSGRTATIVGTEGPDTLVGTRGSDVIAALGGDDVIIGVAGADVLCGGDGADGLSGGDGTDRIAGDGGDDALLGGAGNDFMLGGDGFDIVEGGEGNDRLSGGGQSLDMIAYLFSPTGVTVDFGTGRAFGEGTDKFDGFNAVVGSNGDDTLLGTLGEQWFLPLGGNDTVNGGDGQDVLAYLLSGQGVDVNLMNEQATGEGSDVLEELEVVFGSAHDDALTGTAGYELLFGEEGNDALDGISGGDTLDAGDGTDACTNGEVFVSCENQSSGLVLPEPPEPALGEEPPT